MKDEIIEQLGFFVGQMMLTTSDIYDVMSKEESELEKTEDESRISFIKERLEKYREVLEFLDEAEGLFCELEAELEESDIYG